MEVNVDLAHDDETQREEGWIRTRRYSLSFALCKLNVFSGRYHSSLFDQRGNYLYLCLDCFITSLNRCQCNCFCVTGMVLKLWVHLRLNLPFAITFSPEKITSVSQTKTEINFQSNVVSWSEQMTMTSFTILYNWRTDDSYICIDTKQVEV
jgi:hypothetical protein